MKGLDPDKSEIGGEGGETDYPTSAPLPQKGTPQESCQLALASKLDKIPTHEFIKYRTLLPREITKHRPENTTLASD